MTKFKPVRCCEVCGKPQSLHEAQEAEYASAASS